MPQAPAFTTERRLHPRHRIQSLAYVDLGEDNGGIVLNISEAGLAVQAAITLVEEDIPLIRFQLPLSKNRLEASGRVTWLSSSGTEAGVAFANLPDDVREQIKEWIQLNSAGEAQQAKLPPLEEKIIAEEEPAPSKVPNKEIVSLARPQAPVIPVPEIIPPAAPVSLTKQTEPTTPHARPRMGPATFGSFGRRMSPAPPEIGSAPTPPADASLSAEANPPAMLPPALLADLPATDTTRKPRPARESAFALREPSGQIHAERGGKRRWWALGGAVLSLAAISFAVGMLAGRGDFGGVADFLGSDNSSANSSVAPSAPAPSNSATADPAPAQASPSTDAAIASTPPPEHPRSSSQVMTLRRARVGASEEVTGRQESPAMVTLPENPVSASASVAVRTRRSIPLPSDPRSSTSQGGQNLQIGALLTKSEPAYPPEALSQKIEGTVRLHVWIAEDGKVRQVEALIGPPVLQEAASAAVRGWRYSPTLYDGQPIETEEDVVVVFRLPH